MGKIERICKEIFCALFRTLLHPEYPKKGPGHYPKIGLCCQQGLPTRRVIISGIPNATPNT
jgi:hypothetical protein